MNNFEHIEDYLTNRLSAEEKVQFENELQLDNSLKTDVELQKQIIEGVKKARVAELKAMLNNVPIGSGFTSGLSAGKIATAIVTTSIIGVSLYVYFKPAPATTNEPTPLSENSIQPKDSINKHSETIVEIPVAKEEAAPAKPSTGKEKTKAKKEDAQPAGTPQSKIVVTDPSDELVNNPTKETSKQEEHKSAVTTSTIAVETNNSNKKYNFHYQFNNGKLVLYGSFDRSLYEILEIHGDHHTVFLYYKDLYYLLDEKQAVVTELKPIKDAELLKKLKEYRGK